MSSRPNFDERLTADSEGVCVDPMCTTPIVPGVAIVRCTGTNITAHFKCPSSGYVDLPNGRHPWDATPVVPRNQRPYGG
jgi:hypothetical protein